MRGHLRQRALLGALALAASALTACAPATRAPDAAAAEPEEPEREPFRALGPHERVPMFRVVATNGRVFDSDDLVGKQPFVIVFFTTWCPVCEMKMPEIRAVLAEFADVPAIGVSLDDPDTWANVPGYVARHQLSFPVVRATSFPRFALAYDPLQRIPVVAVVGRNGYLVDYQVGYSVTHRARLAAAVKLARRMEPNAPPFLE